MSRQVRILLAVSLAAFAVSGCKAIEEGTKAISDTTVAGANDPNANFVACGAERQEVELAVESFTLLRGHVPTELELVPDFLRTESTLLDIAPDGTVIPAPGSPCA